jgi:hypothetical protein
VTTSTGDATLLTLMFLAVLVSRATALPGCRHARWTWIGPRRKSSPPGTASRLARIPPEQHEPLLMNKEGNSRDPWNPRPPGPTAAATVIPRH